MAMAAPKRKSQSEETGAAAPATHNDGNATADPLSEEEKKK
jgi:hypothetical protein